jgi:hypothetical protein
MISLGLFTKHRMKRAIEGIIEDSYNDRVEEAIRHLNDLAIALDQFTASRGINRREARDKLAEIAYWIRATNRSRQTRQEQISRHIAELVRMVTVPIPEDPLQALRLVGEEVRDDWFALNRVEPRDKGMAMESLAEDFDNLRNLEPKFRSLSPDIYKRFREILQQAGECTACLPWFLGERPPAERLQHSAQVRFGRLFELIESLMAPEHFELKEVPKEKELSL